MIDQGFLLVWSRGVASCGGAQRFVKGHHGLHLLLIALL
jgi:hypothetical protein